MVELKLGSAARRSATAKRKKAPPRWLNLPGLACCVAVTVLLEILVRAGALAGFLPTPSDMARALASSLFSGAIMYDLWMTLSVYAAGLALAAVLGTALGCAKGLSRRFDNATRLLIELLRPVPAVALIPMAILLLGLAGLMRFSVVTYAAIWPILYNTYYGVRGVEQLGIDTARNFGIPRSRIIRSVVLRSALPSVTTGLRISSSIALILTVTAELVAGTNGLGYFIAQAEQTSRLADMYAGIALTGILGYLLNGLFIAVERRALFWDQSYRERVSA
ncbi:ABC transporter permease [Saccharopolyspora sp. K220]|uniref:ABC transporter permease n=1 Tax=Saccharopolyspora soli TaxID=2926618 RepID=UPI001F5A4CAD|nr:ABC transporter permease [Saccharopolyspora soli]MCI2423767.1 ABC transporter permease [Saccharopolyspora soli]